MCMLHIEFASIILNSDYLLPFEGPVIEHYTRKRSKKDLKRKLIKLILLLGFCFLIFHLGKKIFFPNFQCTESFFLSSETFTLRFST